MDRSRRADAGAGVGASTEPGTGRGSGRASRAERGPYRQPEGRRRATESGDGISFNEVFAPEAGAFNDDNLGVMQEAIEKC